MVLTSSFEWLWHFWPTTILLTVFTIVFILLDEYVAKPIRHRRMEAKRDTDPVVREALEVAERVKKLHKERGYE